MSGTDSVAQLPMTGAVLVRPRPVSVAGGTPASASPSTEVAYLSSVCSSVLVLAESPQTLSDLELPASAETLVPEVAAGALGLLAAALASTDDEWVAVVNAPVPWLSREALLRLWSAREGVQAVVVAGANGPEPSLMLCSRDCLPAIERALGSGRQRLLAFLSSVTFAEVAADELRPSDEATEPTVETGSAEGSPRPATRAATSDDAAPASQRAADSAAKKPALRSVTVALVKDRRDGRLPSERAITVFMNGVEIATVQSSPSHLEEMAVGFLLAEGLLHDRDALRSVDVEETRGLVYIETGEDVPDEMVFKKRYITSGCGKGVTFSSVGHAKGLDRITSDVVVEPAALLAMVHELSAVGEERKHTGGVHGCAFGRGDQLILVREDIGRHNAVDKLLGRAWLDRIPMDDLVLLSTGRVSYEMAVKAAKARVPVVVSRHAVTDLAAEITGDLGVTLVAYCRGNSMVVCTHPERVRGAVAEGSDS